MAKTFTNKISIYLIKDQYSAPEDLFRNITKLKSEEIDDIGTLYYGDSHISPPSWVRKFFVKSFNNESTEAKFKLFSASAKASFVVRCANKTFVVAFGYGRTMLNPGTWEERFGLKVALSVIDSANLRTIIKKNMSVVPKLTIEQMTIDGSIADFGIDIEQDLIQGITGKSKDERFGKTVTGKDALSVSMKIDISSIGSFLEVCHQKYQSNDYKKEFGYIDNISEIKEPKIVQDLDSNLINMVKDNNLERTWMAIPEIVEWEDVSEFRDRKHDESFGDDINLISFLGFLSAEERESLSLRIFKNYIIDCISASSGEIVKSWNAYNCLYCEIQDANESFILSNGKWYQVERDFAEQVISDFNDFRNQPSGVTLPDCKLGEHENIYNERASTELSNMCNMDRKIILYGKGYPKIEFCDLFTNDKKIIHVKHYGTSYVLSHLFAQGLVSGELFLADMKFREKLNTKLPTEYKLSNTIEKPEPSHYEIVFAIISKSANDLDIPFFSKVNLRNAKRRLKTFGYNVSLIKISTGDEEA